MPRVSGWLIRTCVAGRRMLYALLTAGVVLCCTGAPSTAAADPLQHVRLQLKWRHQFQFAGFYAALEKGYYRDAGFEVSILPARPGMDAVQQVVTGQAEFGVASSELVLRYAEGAPVVAMGVIFQHSPLVLFARRQSGIEHIQDIRGKRIALADSETELLAYLQRERIPLNELVREPHHFNPESLLQGKVDVLAGYDTDEAWYLREHLDEYISFTPRASGIDFYGDTLFTASTQVAADPHRVQAFLDASLRGWEYALDHQEEMAKLIHQRYAPDLPVDKLLFEAGRMVSLIRSDMVAPGYNHEGRWHHILETYQQLGVLSPGRQVALESFIFRPARQLDYRWLVWVVMAVLAALAVVSWLAGRFHRLNRELAQQLLENHVLQQQLREEAIRDALTGLFNRRYLSETLQRELVRAAREGQPVSLAIIDLDEFKQINDRLGHAAGDEVLMSISAILREGCRESDIPCRYGGDELVVVMLNATPQMVAAKVERWRARFNSGIVFHGQPLPVTFSAGIAGFPRHAANLDELLLAADHALYAAKSQGRNRTVIAAPVSV
jgi:diguanylate cyclase (GGDEF)-like protein